MVAAGPDVQRPQGRGQGLKDLGLTRQLPRVCKDSHPPSGETTVPREASHWPLFLPSVASLQMQEIFLLPGKTLLTHQDHQWRLTTVPRPSLR